jgi:hypothetical protein
MAFYDKLDPNMYAFKAHVEVDRDFCFWDNRNGPGRNYKKVVFGIVDLAVKKSYGLVFHSWGGSFSL